MFISSKAAKEVLPSLPLVLTSFVQAQPKDNKVQFAKDDRDSGKIHTMVIYNGTTRSVHYFTNSTSPSEQQAVRDLDVAAERGGTGV